MLGKRVDKICNRERRAAATPATLLAAASVACLLHLSQPNIVEPLAYLGESRHETRSAHGVRAFFTYFLLGARFERARRRLGVGRKLAR
jgi:hypothetical protein